MTTTLNDVTARKKKPEPSAEAQAAAELVRLARDNARWGYQRVRREALIDRVGVGDLRLRPVVAGR